MPLKGVNCCGGLVAEWDPDLPLGLAIVVPSDEGNPEGSPDEENTHELKIHFGGRRNLLKNSNVVYLHSEKTRTDRRIKARSYFRIRPSRSIDAPKPEPEPAAGATESVDVASDAMTKVDDIFMKALNAELEAVEANNSSNKLGTSFPAADNLKSLHMQQGLICSPPEDSKSIPNDFMAQQSDGISRIINAIHFTSSQNEANAAGVVGSPSMEVSHPSEITGYHKVKTPVEAEPSCNAQPLVVEGKVAKYRAGADEHQHSFAPHLEPPPGSTASLSSFYPFADDQRNAGQATQASSRKIVEGVRCGKISYSKVSSCAGSDVGFKHERASDSVQQTLMVNQVTDDSSVSSISDEERACNQSAAKRNKPNSAEPVVSNTKAKVVPKVTAAPSGTELMSEQFMAATSMMKLRDQAAKGLTATSNSEANLAAKAPPAQEFIGEAQRKLSEAFTLPMDRDDPNAKKAQATSAASSDIAPLTFETSVLKTEPMPNQPMSFVEALEAATAKAKESADFERMAKTHPKGSVARMELLERAKCTKTRAIELATAAADSARFL